MPVSRPSKMNTLGPDMVRNLGIIPMVGGTTTDIGDYRIHTFTSNGVFTILNDTTVDLLVVGGGGGGGYGGGGAGGCLYNTSMLLSAGSYPVTVGLGGLGAIPSVITSTKGGDSSLGPYIGYGGGYGEVSGGASNGGSGGGRGTTASLAYGGTGVSGQGYKGGDNIVNSDGSGSGGGGAGGAGGNAVYSPYNGGAGGIGRTLTISGTSYTYSSGGGGAGYNNPGTASGGGGAGGGQNNNGGGAPATTYGSAGGGGYLTSYRGGNGYQGVVIVRYRIINPVAIEPLMLIGID